MSLNLTTKEQQLLAIVIREMNEMPNVDFEKVAKKVGISYARNARSSFKRVWDKLKAGGDDGSAEEADDESAKKSCPAKTKTPRKRSLAKANGSSDEEDKLASIPKKAKSTTKKAGGRRKAEKKTSTEPKHAAVVKEEVKEGNFVGEDRAPELSRAEAEDYFDQVDEDVSEYYDPEESEHVPKIKTEYVEEHDSFDGQGGNTDLINEKEGNDEMYASLLGLTVEKYHDYALEEELAEQNHGDFQMSPPTPVAHYSDEEEV